MRQVCIVANEGFRRTLGNYADRLLYAYGDAEQLAERLKWTLALSDSERAHMGNSSRHKYGQSLP